MFPFSIEEIGIIENLITDEIDRAVKQGDDERTKILGRIYVKLTEHIEKEHHIKELFMDL